MAFQKIPKRQRYGRKFLLKLGLRQKSPKLVLQLMVTNVASKRVSGFSSMMTMKTGGRVVVAVNPLQLVTHAVQILRCSMTLVKITKM